MEQPLFRKDHSVHPFGNYRLTVTAPSLRSSLLLSLSLNLLFTACPDNHPPPVADCDPGYHPCESDSTECCLDTTSNDFVWEIDTIGNYGSYLNDVAIIDENDVWVVGYIKDGDSTYNAAHWDGEEWELSRLPAVTYTGTISQGALTSIHVINVDDIWCFSDAGSYVRWNGQEWVSEWIPYRNGGISAVWGTSPSNIYFVGGNGSIVHYDGSGFERMESGTDIWLRSVTGSVDPETGQVQVWAGGWDDLPLRGQLLFLNDANWVRVWDNEHPFYSDPQYLFIDDVWVPDNNNLITYVGGYTDAIIVHHEQGSLANYTIMYHDLGGFIRDINGNSINDYFLVGDFSHVMHYNGSMFYTYEELAGGSRYSAVAQSGDYVFICQAYAPIVVRGIRAP